MSTQERNRALVLACLLLLALCVAMLDYLYWLQQGELERVDGLDRRLEPPLAAVLNARSDGDLQAAAERNL